MNVGVSIGVFVAICAALFVGVYLSRQKPK